MQLEMFRQRLLMFMYECTIILDRLSLCGNDRQHHTWSNNFRHFVREEDLLFFRNSWVIVSVFVWRARSGWAKKNDHGHSLWKVPVTFSQVCLMYRGKSSSYMFLLISNCIYMSENDRFWTDKEDVTRITKFCIEANLSLTFLADSLIVFTAISCIISTGNPSKWQEPRSCCLWSPSFLLFTWSSISFSSSADVVTLWVKKRVQKDDETDLVRQASSFCLCRRLSIEMSWQP